MMDHTLKNWKRYGTVGLNTMPWGGNIKQHTNKTQAGQNLISGL